MLEQKPPIVLCGSHDLSWSIVCHAFTTLVPTLSDTDSATVLGENIRFALPMFSVHRRRGKEAIPLSELICETANRKAANPRDRIFALLGIAQHGQSEYPSPDYELAPNEVFTMYTRAMIEQEQNLDALSYGKRRLPDNGVPSWVLSPDRRNYLHSRLLRGRTRSAWTRGGATGKSKPIISSSPSPFAEDLELCGQKLDRIAKVYSLESFARTISNPNKRWEHIMNDADSIVRTLGLPTLYLRTGEQAVAACMKTVLANDFYVGCALPAEYYQVDIQRLYLKFLREDQGAIAGETSCTSAGAERIPEDEWSEQRLYELAKQAFHFETSCIARRHFDKMTSSATTSQANNRIVQWLDIAVSSNLVSAIGSRSDHQLAVTETGLLSLVPGAANAGDELCLLFGGFHPFVLREAGEYRKYKLLGEAYVHGFMDRSSARECEELCKATSYGDPLGVTKFCLV